MKNKIVLILGLVCIIVGAAVGYFAGFELAQLSGFAISMFGAGLVACQLWTQKSDKKPAWLSAITIVLIAIGAFALGFAGFAKETMTTVITSVFGLAAIIGGLILSAVAARDNK